MRVPVEVWPDGIAPAGSGAPATEPMLGIGYRQFGAGPPLVMIAGQDASMSLWDPRLLARVAQHFTVTIFDLPGVGYSVNPFEQLPRMTVPWLAQETYRFLVAIGADRPLVLGWGLGGAVALALAEGHPHVPTALVLVGASAGGTAAVRPSPAVSAALDSPDITTTGLSALLFSPESSRARRAFVAAVASEVPDDMVAPAILNEARAEQQLLGDDAVYDRLGRVLAPVLIVQGVEDQVSPAANLPLLRGRLRHASELVVVHAGSGVLFEDAAAIVQAIENFTS
jgi:pimeloyl-ACP methyl ester carboxylesterase